MRLQKAVILIVLFINIRNTAALSQVPGDNSATHGFEVIIRSTLQKINTKKIKQVSFYCFSQYGTTTLIYQFTSDSTLNCLLVDSELNYKSRKNIFQFRKFAPVFVEVNCKGCASNFTYEKVKDAYSIHMDSELHGNAFIHTLFTDRDKTIYTIKKNNSILSSETYYSDSSFIKELYDTNGVNCGGDKLEPSPMHRKFQTLIQKNMTPDSIYKLILNEDFLQEQNICGNASVHNTTKKILYEYKLNSIGLMDNIKIIESTDRFIKSSSMTISYSVENTVEFSTEVGK